MTSTEVEKAGFSTEELRGISTWDDLGLLIGEKNLSVANAGEELGDGFSLISTEAKRTLEGEELVILTWSFTEGDNGEFVTLRAVTRAGNRKVIVNDGSTGIRDQMKQYAASAAGQAGRPLYVPRGLRKSTYTVEIDGKPSKATTYYLDTASAA